MLFRSKWHYDREKTGADRRALLGMGAKFLALFLLLLLVLLTVTFWLARSLGMDMTLP